MMWAKKYIIDFINHRAIFRCPPGLYVQSPEGIASRTFIEPLRAMTDGYFLNTLFEFMYHELSLGEMKFQFVGDEIIFSAALFFRSTKSSTFISDTMKVIGEIQPNVPIVVCAQFSSTALRIVEFLEKSGNPVHSVIVIVDDVSICESKGWKGIVSHDDMLLSWEEYFDVYGPEPSDKEISEFVEKSGYQFYKLKD